MILVRIRKKTGLKNSCSACGYVTNRRLERCPSCGEDLRIK